MKRRPALLIWIIMATLFYTLLVWAPKTTRGPQPVTTSQFIQNAADGKYSEVQIEGGNVFGKIDEETSHRALVTDQETLQKILREKKVTFNEVLPINWFELMPMMLLMGIVVIVVIVVSRAGKSGGNILGRIQKNKATIYFQEVKTRFTDVAGADEAVEECRDLIAYLRDPTQFSDLGGRMPKGVMLTGPSGTGKTLLARAVAGEASVPFLSASGSSFVEMFVGVGAARVRDLFEDAKKRAPCIVFIDEIDAVGQKRGGLGRAGSDEREQTLNELLIQLDGFEDQTGIIVMAATNRPEVLDSALLRPGRFDRQVVVPTPDLQGRIAILKVHGKRYKLADDVDFKVLARGTPGMTGADLANLLNEASLHAGKLNKSAVDKDDLDFAKDKVLMGPERKGNILTEKELYVTACHESGHTIAGWFNPEADPLHKVTIIPRGRALGLTMSLPLEDRNLHTKKWLEAQIRLLMGGRAAEDLMIDDITTGASNDLERATDIAREMVVNLGMSALGNRTFGRKNSGTFLDYSNDSCDFGEETQQRIDTTIDEILQKAYSETLDLLKEKERLLKALTAALIEHETLDEAAVAKILGPRSLPDDPDPGT